MSFANARSRLPRRLLLGMSLASALALLVATRPVPAGAGMLCLRPPVSAPVVTPFAGPPCPWCAGNRGLDYGTSAGAPVRAAAGGVVSFAGPVAGAVWVTVSHPDGVRTSYGPLGRLTVRRGGAVDAGTLLGSSAGRLHFGVRFGEHYVDPAPLLAPPVRLVPRLVPLHGRVPPPPSARCPAGGSGPSVR